MTCCPTGKFCIDGKCISSKVCEDAMSGLDDINCSFSISDVECSLSGMMYDDGDCWEDCYCDVAAICNYGDGPYESWTDGNGYYEGTDDCSIGALKK